MGADEPQSRNEAIILHKDTRDLIKELAVRQEKRDDRFEVLLEKQTDILQQVANATTIMNHNSTAMLDFMKNSKSNGSAAKNEGKLIDIIKYMVVAVCGALIALVGEKITGL